MPENLDFLHIQCKIFNGSNVKKHILQRHLYLFHNPDRICFLMWYATPVFPAISSLVISSLATGTSFLHDISFYGAVMNQWCRFGCDVRFAQWCACHSHVLSVLTAICDDRLPRSPVQILFVEYLTLKSRRIRSCWQCTAGLWTAVTRAVLQGGWKTSYPRWISLSLPLMVTRIWNFGGRCVMLPSPTEEASPCSNHWQDGSRCGWNWFWRCKSVTRVLPQ